MNTKLFNETIFGPVQSRRLGISLGVNLLPTNFKLCNFDCIYCECGWTNMRNNQKIKFESLQSITDALRNKLIILKKNKIELDSITFAGNGEPTLHPKFSEIIDHTILLRNEFYPNVCISVLSNSLMLKDESIRNSLKKIEKPILKLDAGSERTFQLINKPINHRSLEWVVEHLKYFNGNLIIQSMFLKGEIDGEIVDNTNKYEVDKWITLLEIIKPLEVMIYSIDRPTPQQNLSKISRIILEEICEKVKLKGIKARVY